MRKNAFLILLVAVVIALGVVWLSASNPDSGSDSSGDALAAGQLLLPDLKQQVNSIEQLEILGAGNQPLVTLNRGAEHWSIAQRDGFQADWPSVRTMLRELSQAKVIAPKTANPEFHARLGLADVDDSNTGGGLLRWGNSDDQALIIGIESEDVTGRYVRKPDQQQSYLVDQQLQVKSDPADWIAADIIDWQASRIAQVTLRHADGDLVRLNRATPDALELQLANTPPNRELSGQWAVNGIANSLVGLRADDVRKQQDDIPGDVMRALFVTDNSINLVITLYTEQLSPVAPQAADQETEESADGELLHLARFDITAEPVAQTDATSDTSDTSIPVNALANETTATEAADRQTSDESVPVDDQLESASQEVEQLQQRLQGWDFIIPEYKFNAIYKRMDDMLKPLPSEDEADSGADVE